MGEDMKDELMRYIIEREAVSRDVIARSQITRRKSEYQEGFDAGILYLAEGVRRIIKKHTERERKK